MLRHLLIIGIGVLAIAGTARFTAPAPERDLHVSEEFRSQAQKTFDAIKRCDDYRMNGAIFYEPRLLEAQTALDSLGHKMEGIAELNGNQILFNYLLAVEVTRMDWQYFAQTKKAKIRRDEETRINAYMQALHSF